MLESIHIGMTGLIGYSQGLRVIANNTANINTPGFKGSTLRFADLFYTNGGFDARQHAQLGHGLDTRGTSLSFGQGELRQTGNDTDIAVDGAGLFILRKEDGGLTYSRAGQFGFSGDGILTDRNDGAKVMALDGNGGLAPVSLAGLRTNAAGATGTIKFNGNLSSTAGSQTVGGIKVIDADGAEHALELRFTSAGSDNTGNWTLELLEGGNVAGTAQMAFENGKPAPSGAMVAVSYAPPGKAAVPLLLDFSSDVVSYASGSLASLTVVAQDGHGPGDLTATAFDAQGTLILTYSNGQQVKGPKLALARFDAPDAVLAAGDNRFIAADGYAWSVGAAGADGFGGVESGVLEISNVDLSQEFSNLVVMQRGYQASSQVIAAANDMLQELFGMKSK